MEATRPAVGEELMDEAEAAAYLRISPRTLQDLRTERSKRAALQQTRKTHCLRAQRLETVLERESHRAKLGVRIMPIKRGKKWYTRRYL